MTLGFFKRLDTLDDEEALLDGCRELVLENEDKAPQHVEQAAHLADGVYLAGAHPEMALFVRTVCEETGDPA